jgi:hypothetical protein
LNVLQFQEFEIATGHDQTGEFIVLGIRKDADAPFKAVRWRIDASPKAFADGLEAFARLLKAPIEADSAD